MSKKEKRKEKARQQAEKELRKYFPTEEMIAKIREGEPLKEASTEQKEKVKNLAAAAWPPFPKEKWPPHNL